MDRRQAEIDDDIGWLDGSPLIDIALGGALVALRELHPNPDAKSVERLDSEVLQKAMAKGGEAAVRRSLASLRGTAKEVRDRFKGR